MVLDRLILIVGINMCGKSTLIKLLEQPTKCRQIKKCLDMHMSKHLFLWRGILPEYNAIKTATDSVVSQLDICQENVGHGMFTNTMRECNEQKIHEIVSSSKEVDILFLTRSSRTPLEKRFRYMVWYKYFYEYIGANIYRVMNVNRYNDLEKAEIVPWAASSKSCYATLPPTPRKHT